MRCILSALGIILNKIRNAGSCHTEKSLVFLNTYTDFFKKIKKIMKRLFTSVMFLFIVSYLSSCTSVTDMTGTWKKSSVTAKKYNKIAVLGLSGDVVKRSSVENAVVAEFRKYGIPAVAGTDVLPDSFMDSDKDGKADDKNKDAIAAKLKELGVDGSMVLSLLDVKESEHYVPGTAYYSPYSGYYPFNSYYWGTYNTVYTPGYTTKSKNYFLSSNFYDMSDEQLIWSAQSETINPQSLQDFSASFSKALVEEFMGSNIAKK